MLFTGNEKVCYNIKTKIPFSTTTDHCMVECLWLNNLINYKVISNNQCEKQNDGTNLSSVSIISRKVLILAYGMVEWL